MEQNKVIRYDKLIRDRIPEIIEKSGSKAIVEVLDNQEDPKGVRRVTGSLTVTVKGGIMLGVTE